MCTSDGDEIIIDGLYIHRRMEHGIVGVGGAFLINVLQLNF